METNIITNLDTCWPSLMSVLNNSLTLLYYSHIPTIVISLILGIFVLVKGEGKILSKIFFSLSFVFIIWSILDLFTWLSNDTRIIMFTWSLTGIVETLFFILSLYFVYVFIEKKDATLSHKVFWVVLLLPLMLASSTKYNLLGFNTPECYSLENNYSLYYKFLVEILSFIFLVIYSVIKIKQANKEARKEIVPLFVGVILFLFSFFYTVFLSGYLADQGVAGYSIEFYGLFGTMIFMASLVFIIVKFKAFDIKLIGAQALVWALVILVGSQFLFVQSLTAQILTGITLIISAIVGLIIVRSVKKEVALREELEIANRNQESLMHFISHQIKGFFTKSKMIFAGLLDGDFGEVGNEAKEMAKIGLESNNNAVAMVQDILGASNLKTGTTNYNFKLLDLVLIVKKVADNFAGEMEKKGLKFETDISTVPLPTMADETQIIQVFKNLMDNSLHYTPSGEIKVSFKVSPTDKRKALFVVKDTGIGLSDKDKEKLFTEGGKGEESLKVNTNSTGYGLYIVKKIVESHKGRIWAESAGRGHGSKFCVELPVTGV